MVEVIFKALNKLLDENPKIVIILTSLLCFSIIIPIILKIMR